MDSIAVLIKFNFSGPHFRTAFNSAQRRMIFDYVVAYFRADADRWTMKNCPLRKCKKCPKSILPELRADACYCTEACRSAAYAEQHRLMYTRPKRRDFAAFKRKLMELGPPNATHYALAWPIPDTLQVSWSPPPGIRSKRFSGCFAVGGNFMQRPRFECPRVPYVGIYGIVFFDENNCELPTPAALLCGIRVPAAFPRRIVPPRGHKKKAVSEQPADQGMRLT